MPIGCSCASVLHRLPEGVARRQPALLHRGRGQAREPDHVADGVDVLHGGAVVGRRPRSARGRPRRARRSSRSSESVAPWRPAEYMHRVGGNQLPARERRHRAGAVLLDGGHLLAEAEDHVQVAQVVLERLDDLESQNSSRRRRCSTTVTLQPSAANIEAYSMPMTPAPTTTSEFGSQSRPRTSSESMIGGRRTRRCAGWAGRVPTAITIRAAVDPPLVARRGRDVRAVCGSTKRPRARSGARRGFGAAGCGRRRSRARRRAACGDSRSCDGDLVLDPIALAVDPALAHAREVEDGLAQRLRRDRARVHADAADHLPAIDDRDALAELRGRIAAFCPPGPEPITSRS